MEILSLCSNKIRLHKSPSDLSVVCEQNQAVNAESLSDFSILPTQNAFLKINKTTKSLFELWRIVRDPNTDEKSFDLIRKSKTESLSAVAACKTKGEKMIQFATGYFSGIIKIRNLDKNCSVVKEFSPKNSSSVAFMDFNCSDENLVCVYEDCSVNIFGLQTMVKLDTFNLDRSSTLARFHPSRKSQLAVISDKGNVSVLDIFTKKPSFVYKEAHSSPCTDVQITNEELLISCSYDSTIRIFDLRKSSVGLQIQASYGWTTLSISKCGTYFVGGNLKGEIICYDMRNIKKPLKSIRVDNENLKISRIAFLQSNVNSPAKNDLSQAIRKSFSQIEEEIKTDNESNDSYVEDIIGFHKGRISDFSSSALCHGTRVSTTRQSIKSRMSENFGINMQEALNDLSFSTEDAADGSSLKMDDSRVNKDKRRVTSKDKRRSSTVPTLQLINEELSDKENDAKMFNTEKSPTDINQNSPHFSSTPTITITKSSPKKSENLAESKEVIVLDEEESFKSIENTGKQETPFISASFDFCKEFKNLSEKIHFEVQSLNMDQNMRHIQLMSFVTEQRRSLQDRIKMIENSIALLMNDDFKINRIMELQAENDNLRSKMNEMMRRANSSDL